MLEINQLLPEVTNLNQSLQQFVTQKECDEISVYTGEIASREIILSETKKLVAAFPEITNDFIILLIDRLTDNKFTAQRVKDAINNIIDNSPYKRPSIADIISFDKKIKTFSFDEIQSKCRWDYPAFNHFNRVQINGKWRYVEK